MNVIEACHVNICNCRQLLTNARERRIVVVESPLSTTLFRNTLAKVLFEFFQVKIFADTFTLRITISHFITIAICDECVCV